jgi:hypothetical protein
MLLGEKTHWRCVSNFKATIIDKAQFVAPSKKKKRPIFGWWSSVSAKNRYTEKTGKNKNHYLLPPTIKN